MGGCKKRRKKKSIQTLLHLGIEWTLAPVSLRECCSLQFFFSFAVLILSQSLFCRRQEQPSSPDPGKGSEKEKQIPPYPFSSFGFDGVQSANFSSLLALHFGKQCRWRGKVIASGWLCNNIVTFLLMGQEKNLFQVLLLLLDDIDDYFSVYEIVVFELYVALILC